MAISEDLHAFVRDGLSRGLSRGQLDDVLTRSGWAAPQVRGALAEFAEVEFPIPVPRPRPYLDARDAFQYLLVFSTLYICAFHLGTLIFEFINRAFPDPAAREGIAQLAYRNGALRWSIASLIVATPVFLYVSMLTARAVRLDPAKRGSKVRRWLTYTTLFVAASILIGDVITLIYNALGGELTIRFLLKVLTVGAIAGAVFGYYKRDLRADESGARS